MNETINTIMKRRSIRRFDSKQLDENNLNLIIEAGRFAPSGGNNQSTHLIVIQSEETLSKLSNLVQTEFAKMEIEENMYKSLKGSILASKKGNYHFHYNAPTLIVVANKKEYGNAIADSSCVLENMMIAATSVNIGSCWINQLRWLDSNAAVHEMMMNLGLKDNEIICGGLALGYLPDDMDYPKALSHTGNPVTWVK